MQTIGSIIDKATSLSRYLGFGCLLAVAGITSVGAVARYFFNRPFVFTEEVVMSLMIPLVACSLAYVFQIKGHIRADLVLRLLPLKWQNFLDRVTDFLTIVILTIVATEFYRQMGICLSIDRRFETIVAWPMWPVRAIGFLGLCFTAIYITRVFIQGCLEMIKSDTEHRFPQKDL